MSAKIIKNPKMRIVSTAICDFSDFVQSFNNCSYLCHTLPVTRYQDIMKRFHTFFPVLMLSMTVFLAVSCKPSQDPNDESPDSEAVVNPNYVPIDWQKATLLSANDSIGAYQIRFTQEMPELKPGSIIAIDRDTAVRYVFVESLVIENETVSLNTTAAYLTDIFANTEITLTTVEDTKSTASSVFYPTDVYLEREDGSFQKGSVKGLDNDGLGFTHYLWNYQLGYYNIPLLSGSHFSINLDTLLFDFDLGVEMKMNFGGRDVHEITENLLDRYRSRALNINAYLIGNFNSVARASYLINGEVAYDNDYEIWKHNPVKTPRIKFLVYGVPVMIQINSDLYRHVMLSANGEISCYSGIRDNAEGRLGIEWQQDGGLKPVNSFSNMFTFIEPTLEGKGQIEGKLYVFPRFRLILYDLLGPSIDIMPYLSTTLSGGFKQNLIGQGQECAWSLDCNTGVDFRGGLSLQFMGYEVENYSTPTVNLVDKELYHAPKRIEHNGKDDFVVGNNNTITFEVFDRNNLLESDVLTPLTQYMRFEANGALSSNYGIVHDGRVSVDWTPTQGDFLYAKLYDMYGAVLASDTLRASSPGDWVDLGLPSGTLWATHNIGANAPEECGDYFAWAEIQPKELYNWSTYKYGDQENRLTKYCYNPNNGLDGYVDDLTVILPEDDAATINWGEEWCIPTSSQLGELLSYTTFSWTSINGSYGGLFTAPNGNSVFLPAGGAYIASNHFYAGQVGVYFSSNIHPDTPSMPSYFAFHVGNNSFPYCRANGAPIRPVRSTQGLNK